MNSVSNILNRVNEWSDPSNSALKRHVATRATNLFVTAPLETLAVAQNALLIAPFQAVSMTLKAGARAIQYISGSEAVKKFADNRSGLSDLLRTIARTFQYAIGALLSATVGVIAPTTNYKIQHSLGFVFAKEQDAVEQASEEADLEAAAGVNKAGEQGANVVQPSQDQAKAGEAAVLAKAEDLAAKADLEAEDASDEVDEVVEEMETKAASTFSAAVNGITSMATAPFRAFARVFATSAN